MSKSNLKIRLAKPQEFEEIGKLMVKVYSQLDGFPSQTEQPEYYKMLLNIGDLTKKPHTDLIVAISEENEVMAAVVYFNDMSVYGSGGTATKEKNSSGFRLLAVDPRFRGKGLGKKLSQVCIDKARKDGNEQVIIHSTKFMQVAWKIYKELGFKRSEDLDFWQGQLPVFGFRFKL
ncbi:GNAT family N-acetyltransferase [Gramella sp. MAR_2010_147]|uniref:GNAT family N-acetyltransferase n=1 Tax=Gramella sp. MAR_2010_147 TaxID=1250205 RepID=UPI00087DC1FC|nr:GNAT family N-acetyltransferase [Gramella sp. MAR_2010_147]SDR92514.1 Acetyltransferase (GNAT) domain-containing protein [Gramella sp. MAR_2010_147]